MTTVDLVEVVDTLMCQRCGFWWERARVPGPKPAVCPDCATVPAPRGERLRQWDGVSVTSPAYQVAAAAVRYRIAFELIGSLLRLSHCTCPRCLAVLAVLDQVEAPGRTARVRIPTPRKAPA